MQHQPLGNRHAGGRAMEAFVCEQWQQLKVKHVSSKSHSLYRSSCSSGGGGRACSTVTITKGGDRAPPCNQHRQLHISRGEQGTTAGMSRE
jgi:hypothetical protein